MTRVRAPGGAHQKAYEEIQTKEKRDMIDGKPDIEAVLQAEGVDLRRGWRLSPLGVGL